MKKGFTLVELLVVIAIIGLLASIVLVNLQGVRGRGRVAAGKQFSSQLQSTLGSEAVGIWRFDEGSGTTAYDNAGYGNNGTLTNSPIWRTEDECGLGLGTCLEFDGVNDYVTAGNASVLDVGDGDFTASAWIYPTTTSKKFFLQKSDLSDGWTAGLNNSGDNQIFLELRDSASANNQVLTYNTAIQANTWYHVAIVKSGADMTVYKNGSLVGTYAAYQDMSNSSVNFQIGRLDWWSPGYFQGRIDQIALYASSLTTAQVQQLYAQGLKNHQIASQ